MSHEASRSLLVTVTDDDQSVGDSLPHPLREAGYRAEASWTSGGKP
jgi:hypothetical protein